MEETRNDNLKFPSVDKIQDECHYKYHMTIEAFNTIENPVIDTQGNLRGKNDPDILIGLHDRDPLKPFNNLTYIESAHIMQVQEDFVKYGEHYHNLYCGYEVLESKCEKQSVELATAIDNLNSSTKEITQLKGYAAYLEKKNTALKATIVEKNQQIEALTTENQRLNTENTNLTTENTNKSHRITNLINENIRLSANSNVVNQSLNTDPFSNEKTKLDDCKTNVSTKRVVYGEAVGVKKDRLRGIKYSINWFDHDNINERNEHTKKNLEDFLRTTASLGNNTIIDDFLKNCSKNYNCNALDIINGRGEPDSISSNIFGYKDKTPLMIAAENGHTDCVQTLINYNANVNYLDRNNKTALDYAHKFWKKNKSSNVRQPLWENGAVPSSCCEVLPAGKVPVK